MSSKQAADVLSSQFGINSPVGESPNEKFLRIATTPVFPFMHMNVIPDEKVDDASIDIKVNKKTYDFLMNAGPYKDIVLYLTNDGRLASWNFDMIIAIKTLSNIGILPKIEKWAKNGRMSLTKILSAEKFDPIFDEKNALKNSNDILSSLDILDHVKETELFFSAANEARRERYMDSSTLIYRLAMAVYHSYMDTTQSISSSMGDPSSTYIKLIKSSFFIKWESKFSEMMNLPLESRIKITKILIAFTIASYVYHKTLEGSTDV